MWLFFASVNLLVPEQKYIKNVLENVCNLWIKC